LNKKYLLLLLFTILLHLSGYYFLIKRIEPFQFFSYLVFWWSYIVFVDTLLAIRLKRFIILNGNLPFLIVISSGFWCMYEIINLRLENWFYINLPDKIVLRWAGYMLAFGTVIPALHATKELIRSLIGEIGRKPVPLKNYSMSAMCIGLAALIVTLAFPLYGFPLAWIFLVLIIDGFNYVKGFPSFLGEAEQGLAGNLISTALAGLLCGMLWETWNFWSISKWVYTVPFFENLKIFEMPLPGYVGFLFFAVGTIAFVNLLQGFNVYKSYPIRATSAALAFSLFSFAMIDRHTVFSYTGRIEELLFLDEAKIVALRARGVQSSFGIDPALLDTKEKAVLSLMHLKGLGHDHYLQLKAHGIDSISALMLSDEATLSRILNEPNLRRIRVYSKAAKQVVKSENRALGYGR
jgi:hypothetical protein